MEHIPRSFQLVYPHSQVLERTYELGKAVSDYALAVWRDSHTDILAIPILRGGLFFFAHLVQALDYSIEIAAARAWGYEGNTLAAQLRLALSDIPARGRAVLVVDDICDTGRTLDNLKAALLSAGAREVRSAVLVKRLILGPSLEPDYVGFKYQGSEWLVGWGMDDGERYRNLKDIYAIKQPLPTNSEIGA